jgi:hypothetical protein
MSDVDRHVAVFPIAKGPKTTVQPTTEVKSFKPLTFARLVQAGGRDVTQADGAGPVVVGTQVL